MTVPFPPVSDPPDDGETALVEFLLAQPTAAATLLDTHTDDGGGRCRVCTAGAQRGHSAWPCTLHVAARRAAELRPGGHR